MWFKKKRRVLCSNCGFFSIRSCSMPPRDLTFGPLKELAQGARVNFQSAALEGDFQDPDKGERHIVLCLNTQWRLFGPRLSKANNEIIDTIRQPRQCPYFIKYQPGYSPEEHKELRRDAEMRHAIMKASILAGIIGASSAIAAQLLYVYLATPR